MAIGDRDVGIRGIAATMKIDWTRIKAAEGRSTCMREAQRGLRCVDKTSGLDRQVGQDARVK